MIGRSRYFAIVLALLAVTPAWAVGPSREVVQERLYSFDGRFDVGVLGGLSMNNKLTDQYGFILQPAYHFTDAWAFELTTGYVLAQEKRRLTSDIRQEIGRNGDLRSEFADMGTMQWLAQGALRWSPIYGKFSLVSELPLYFSAYVSAGGGVAGVNRRSMVDCSPGSVDEAGYYRAECDTESDVRWSASAAIGLRFYLSERISLRAELKDFIFPDKYRLYIGSPDERVVNDLSSVLMFLAGASFYF